MKTITVAAGLALTLALFGGGAASQTPPQPGSSQSPAHAQGKALTNADLIRMVQAGMDDETLVVIIRDSQTHFDTSPDALIELKKAGAGKQVIQAVLEAGMRPASGLASGGAEPAQQPVPAQPANAADSEISRRIQQPPQIPPEAQAMMAAMGMGRMYSAGSGEMPRAYRITGAQKLELTASMAQAARSQLKGVGSSSTATLESLGIQAISFGAMIAAGPVGAMVGSFAGVVPAMHHRTPTMTYIWALPGPTSASLLAPSECNFEFSYADLPGIDPDEWEPVLVKLVTTRDNWRVVGVSKVMMTEMARGGLGQGEPVVQDKVPVQVERRGHGDTLIQAAQLEPGQYGLVLRPLKADKRKKGALGGGARSQTFLAVWDFTVPGSPAPDSTTRNNP